MHYLKVKNWDEFQHYKKRTPPWIKLHRDILNNYEFSCLQDASKAHLMLIWLLASQMDNKIPADAEFLKTRINIKETINLKELVDMGFLVYASNPLADCKQSAIVEAEAEAEAEAENKKLSPKKIDLPEYINSELFADYLTMRKSIKSPMTDKAKLILLNKIEKLRNEGNDANKLLEVAIMSNWKSVYETDTTRTIERINNNGTANRNTHNNRPTKVDAVNDALEAVRRGEI